MAFWRRSIVWSLMAPIPVLAICVLLIGSTLPNRIGNQIVSAAIANAENTVEQFMVLRGYYTKNVISKVIKSTGPKPAIDHADDPRAIPLPATMIHDLIPTVIDQNPCAHLRMPRDMIFHGWSMRLFQAWQHSATMSS